MKNASKLRRKTDVSPAAQGVVPYRELENRLRETNEHANTVLKRNAELHTEKEAALAAKADQASRAARRVSVLENKLERLTAKLAKGDRFWYGATYASMLSGAVWGTICAAIWII